MKLSQATERQGLAAPSISCPAVEALIIGICFSIFFGGGGGIQVCVCVYIYIYIYLFFIFYFYVGAFELARVLVCHDVLGSGLCPSGRSQQAVMCIMF